MNEKVRAPSIHDVAAFAGVSHQTVSRFLNGYAGIRPATRAKVEDAIEQLGYRRNLTARTLATGQSHTIGLIGPEIPDIGPLSSLHSVERAARDAGFHTLTTSSSAEPDQICEALEFMMSRSIDALVLVAQHQSIQDAAAQGVGSTPTIHLLSGGVPEGSAISVNQRAGVEVIMNHLMTLGHRSIQHVSGPLEYAEARLRRDAFIDVVKREGLVSLPILEGEWSSDAGYALGSKLDRRATAVFCANDQLAFGLMHSLSDGGRQVPQDISVVGFDDTPEARHSMPPLTTVHQDFEAVGKLAVATLVAQLRGEKPPHNEPLTPWLVQRSSTARMTRDTAAGSNVVIQANRLRQYQSTVQPRKQES